MATMGRPAFFGIRQSADGTRSRITVHDRHLNIHQHQIIVPGRSRATLSTAIFPFSAVSTSNPPSSSIVTAISRLRALSSTTSSRFPAKSAFFLRLLRRLCRKKRLSQYAAQLGHEQRLGAERGHACGLCLNLDIRPVVGGQDDDRGCCCRSACGCGARPQGRSDRVSSSR